MPFRILFLFSLLLSPISVAAESLQLSQAWARATPPNAGVAGAFLHIENTSRTADRLLSVQTDAAKSVEIHEMRMEGDLMQMRELKAGIILAAKTTTVLKPGGIHLMLIAPKQPLIEGQTITLHLIFENAGKRTLQFKVYKQAPSTTTNAEHHH